MIIEVTTTNANQLHDELINAGLAPTSVTTCGITTLTTLVFDDGVVESNIQEIIAAHTPMSICVEDNRKERMAQLIDSSTVTQLGEFFQALPAEHKPMFIACFTEHYIGSAVDCASTYLLFESTFRILLETLYIREVENRALTTEEQTTYHNLLNSMHNHNTLLGEMQPLDSFAQPLITRTLEGVSTVLLEMVLPVIQTE